MYWILVGCADRVIPHVGHRDEEDAALIEAGGVAVENLNMDNGYY